jgi:hypothetical protein
MSDAADASTATAPLDRPRSPLAGTFGVRLFYHPHSRQRLAVIAAAAAAVFYVVRGLLQIVLLPQSSLRYDYKPYLDAGITLNNGGDPYAAFLNACGPGWCHVGYVYPPLLAELFRPLGLLAPYTGARLWLLLSHAAVIGTIVVVHKTVGGWLSLTTQASLLTASLLFLPLYQNLWFLQVGALLIFILALSAWAFVRDQTDGLAGAAIGLASVLRVSPLVMAPLLVRSRRQLSRPRGAAGLVLAIAGLFAILAILTPTTWEFLGAVLPRLAAGTATIDNQSMPGVLLRVEALFQTGHLPVAIAIRVLQVVVVALTWIASLGVQEGRGRAAVFAAFLATVPIVSSITWDHHLMNELLVLALLAPSLHPGERPFGLALASYPLLWVGGGLTQPLAGLLGLVPPHGLTAVPFLLVTSLNLAGMALLWLACLDVLAHRRFKRPATPAPPPRPAS